MIDSEKEKRNDRENISFKSHVKSIEFWKS